MPMKLAICAPRPPRGAAAPIHQRDLQYHMAPEKFISEWRNDRRTLLRSKDRSRRRASSQCRCKLRRPKDRREYGWPANPFTDARDHRSEASPHSAACASIRGPRSTALAPCKRSTPEAHETLKAASKTRRRCRGAPFTHSCPRLRRKADSKIRAAQTREGRRGRKIAEAFQKEYAEHACDGQAILRASRSGRTGSPALQNENRGQSQSPFP